MPTSEVQIAWDFWGLEFFIVSIVKVFTSPCIISPTCTVYVAHYNTLYNAGNLCKMRESGRSSKNAQVFRKILESWHLWCRWPVNMLVLNCFSFTSTAWGTDSYHRYCFITLITVPYFDHNYRASKALSYPHVSWWGGSWGYERPMLALAG